MVIFLILLAFGIACLVDCFFYDAAEKKDAEVCENCQGYGCIYCNDTGCRPKD